MEVTRIVEVALLLLLLLQMNGPVPLLLHQLLLVVTCLIHRRLLLLPWLLASHARLAHGHWIICLCVHGTLLTLHHWSLSTLTLILLLRSLLYKGSHETWIAL